MAQHPDDRPASIEGVRTLLVSKSPVTPLMAGGLPAAASVQGAAWQAALRTNRLLLMVALLLMTAALAVTIWSPLLPP